MKRVTYKFTGNTFLDILGILVAYFKSKYAS
jgi:hypothetical protein